MIKLTLIQGDALKVLKHLPLESVDLVITSPPYNIGIDYGIWKDNLEWNEYLKFSEKWLSEIYRVLKKDGRFALNIPNAIKNSECRIAHVVPIFINMLEKIGFKTMEWITWVKGKAIIDDNGNYIDSTFCGNNTAWGSWCSPKAPYLRSLTESIILVYKEKFKKDGKKEYIDIKPKEFKEWTKNVWFIPTNNDKTHPAVYPIELVKRILKLYSYQYDTVLDPFLGSGTTMRACLELKRNCIGIEINPEYIQLTKKRLNWGYNFGNVHFEFYTEKEFCGCG